MNHRISVGVLIRFLGILAAAGMALHEGLQQDLYARLFLLLLLVALELWCYLKAETNNRIWICIEAIGTLAMALSLGATIAIKLALNVAQVGILIGGLLGIFFAGGMIWACLAVVRNVFCEIRQRK